MFVTSLATLPETAQKNMGKGNGTAAGGAVAVEGVEGVEVVVEQEEVVVVVVVVVVEFDR
jgi:hypothetical protein